MTDNLPARVAALEMLVEQLILERAMLTDARLTRCAWLWGA